MLKGMYSINLFSLKNEEIKISIEARFEGEALIIDGYDIGKKVKEYWGDSDYEYTTTIYPESVKQLYTIFGIEGKRFNTNTCYSEIQKLLDDNHIAYQGFSWI